MFKLLVIYILIGYISINYYMVNGYENKIDNLMKANTNLMQSCNNIVNGNDLGVEYE